MAYTTAPALATQTRSDKPAAPMRQQQPPAIVGNQALLRRLSATHPHIQTKLAIGAVNDPLEHEADRVAEQVMRMPEPAPTLTAGPEQLNRKCAACAEEERLLPKRAAAATPATGEAPAAVHRALGQSGQALDGSTRSFFEARLGADLSGVRVHQGGAAAAAARSVDARAFAVGRDIVFAEGAFAPASAAGRTLLAHELAHVLQQSQGDSSVRLQRQPDAGAGPAPPAKQPNLPDQTPNADEAPADLREAALQRRLTQDELDTTGTRNLRNLRAFLVRSRTERDKTQSTDPKNDVVQENIGVLDTELTGRPRCDEAIGKGNQPKAVSQDLLDRMMSKHANDKDAPDPGEHCEPQPYPAGNGEPFCTIGFGHLMSDPPCPVFNKETNSAPTDAEIKAASDAQRLPGSWLGCTCAGKISFDCKGKQAENQLLADVGPHMTDVHEHVPVDLNQAQFDALVDLSLSHGSIEKKLLDAIKFNWCTKEGRNYVRDVYLQTDIVPQKSTIPSLGLVNRRKLRVWPAET